MMNYLKKDFVFNWKNVLLGIFVCVIYVEAVYYLVAWTSYLLDIHRLTIINFLHPSNMPLASYSYGYTIGTISDAESKIVENIAKIKINSTVFKITEMFTIAPIQTIILRSFAELFLLFILTKSNFIVLFRKMLEYFLVTYGFYIILRGSYIFKELSTII